MNAPVFTHIIAGRRRNGYETVGDIKVAFIDSFKQLEVTNKVDTSKTKLHVFCKHGTHEKASFVSLDDLGNISILLDEVNNLEEEITHLFNEVFLFSSLKKYPNQSGSKYTQNMHRITDSQPIKNQ